MGIQGKYYSFTAASAAANTDLIVLAEQATGTDIMAKRLEIFTSGSLAFAINGGTSSLLFKDGTGYYHLLLTDEDIDVASFMVSTTSACAIFLSLVY